MNGAIVAVVLAVWFAVWFVAGSVGYVKWSDRRRRDRRPGFIDRRPW